VVSACKRRKRETLNSIRERERERDREKERESERERERERKQKGRRKSGKAMGQYPAFLQR
jgi:hypothetical protein